MPSDDDDLIEAAPCPKCKSPLGIVVADLGHLIECPSCGTQSRARRADAPPADAPPSRRRSRDEDREDDRDRDERPVRRRRPDDDEDRRDRDRRRDDDDRRPLRRPGQGAAVGAAVMNFVFAVVALIQGACGGFIGANAMSEGPRGDHDAPFGSNRTASLVFLGFGGCNLVGIGLMIPAGIGLLQRRPYGRTLGVLSAGLGLLYAFGLVAILIAIYVADPTTESAAVVAFLFPILLWLGYAVTNLILLGKVRTKPTR